MPTLANRRGFTLIELLVVVAIIALLISILLPSLSKARETARMVKCLAIQKQYGIANHMYADNQDGLFVQLRNNTSKQAPVGGFWGANGLYRQMIGLRVGGSSSTPGQGETTLPEMICPSKQPESVILGGWWRRSFSFSGIATNGWGKTNTWAIVRAKVVNPSSKVQGMDAVHWGITQTGQMRASTEWDIKGDTDSSSIVHGAFRHHDLVSILYHDGHASTLSKDEAWKSPENYRRSLYGPLNH